MELADINAALDKSARRDLQVLGPEDGGGGPLIMGNFAAAVDRIAAWLGEVLEASPTPASSPLKKSHSR